jgi:transcription initiation factor TFIIIB Brf1 subunit/transcription initiation factor TFIIB
VLPNNRTNLCNKVHTSTITDADSGEVICITCGAVVSDKAIEIGPEWCSFTSGGVSLSRVGMPISLAKHDQGLHKNWKREQGFYW